MLLAVRGGGGRREAGGEPGNKTKNGHLSCLSKKKKKKCAGMEGGRREGESLGIRLETLTFLCSCCVLLGPLFEDNGQ